MPNVADWTPEQIAIVASALAALIGAVAAVASAVFAWLAVRTQRRLTVPHVKVKHANVFPVYGGEGRNLYGSELGEVWFAITVHNDGLVPVTVQTVALALNNGGTAPYIRPPWPGMAELPKPLPAGEEATFWLDELRKIAQVHAEHGGAKWALAKIGGSVEFHGKPIKRAWLDGWAKPD